MDSLDAHDRRILFELDRNSRQSIADLARLLRLNRDRIVYRIKQLERGGVIKSYTTAINPAKLGLFVYKTYLRTERNDSRLSELSAHLGEHPRVHWFAECDGKWDMMFSIYASNPFEFYAVLEEILFEFSDIIVSFNIYTIIDAWCFRKSYLVGIGTDSYFFGGPPDVYKIDEIDRAVLRALSRDSRQSKLEIAETLRVSGTLIKQRIDRLEDSGVISGYPLGIDLSVLGLSFFKAQLHFGSYDRHSAQLLLDFCKTHPHITYFISQIGDCTTEIELEVESFAHFSDILADIRQRFSRFVRSIDSVMIRKQLIKWDSFLGDEGGSPRAGGSSARQRAKRSAAQGGGR